MLRGLLAGLYALGKKTGIGYGRIASCDITCIPDDRSVVWEGKTMWSIPCEMLNECELSEQCGWRPPYWNSLDIRICALPGASVTMKSGRKLRRTAL